MAGKPKKQSVAAKASGKKPGKAKTKAGTKR